jgi:hypothetical protein
VLYCFGAKETDPSGEHILLDSKETRETLRFAKALYDEGMTAEVFSWDDASDNRYLASGVACWIHDAISAYRTTEDTGSPWLRHLPPPSNSNSRGGHCLTIVRTEGGRAACERQSAERSGERPARATRAPVRSTA